MMDNGRQPIAIKHLSESGDLKLYSNEIEGMKMTVVSLQIMTKASKFDKQG